MGTYDNKFRSAKLDQSPYLFHFNKGTVDEAKTALCNILKQQKLVSNRDNFNCFTASPITSLHKFFDTMVNRTGLPMYQPFGIGFARDLLIKHYGARNVIYCDQSEEGLIPESFKWRCQTLNVDSYDFEYLREWRIKGHYFDFNSFPKEHLLVIAPYLDDVNDLVTGHELVITPHVNWNTGDTEPYYEERFFRKYPGLSMKEISSNCINDFQVSGITLDQQIQEDMSDSLQKGFEVYTLRQNNNNV